MLAMLLVVSLQILSRFTGIIPRYLWTEEVARFCFVWIVMIGSAVAVRDGTHFDVDLLPQPRSRRAQGVWRFITHLAMMVLSFLFVRYGAQFAVVGFSQRSELSEISMLGIYIAFPIAGICWVAFLLEHMMHDLDMIQNKPTDDKL